MPEKFNEHPIRIYTEHLITSIVFLLMLIGLLFLARDSIQSILLNSQDYFISEYTANQINIDIIFVAFAIIIVLMSFIFYLLLTYKSRFELGVWNETKTLSFAKDQFKRLYESAPVPYIMLDREGNIKNPNKAALRFFSAFPEDIEDKNLFSYISEGSDDGPVDFLKLYKSKVPINRKETEMVTKNGSKKSVMLSVFDMRGPGSIYKEGLAVIIDITEQKQIEKAKTDFLSLASHQLKTPLATTRWYTEALMSEALGTLNEKQKKYIEVLNSSNRDMIELVDILLNISRLEMGSMVLEKVSTNVQSLSESVLNELALNIENKKIKINKNYNDKFTDVKSDPRFLRVVIQNLISNAVKYTPEGGEVSIDFEENAEERMIVITDTGVGIPVDQQQFIFSKMFRADNVKNIVNSQGSGLGLYLVKSIIVSMGGDIRFTSQQNKGSKFTIVF